MDRHQPGPDIHTTAGKLASLDLRIEEAVHAGSAAAVEKQHARGKKTARERLELLLDPARSPNWMSSPGTGRRPSGWRSGGRTATGW